MNLNAGVSPLQFFIIIINTSFGAGMLSMPRTVAEVTNEDMWLTVICGGGVFLFAFWAVAKLSQYYPGQTCLEYHRILLGPILGQLLNVILLSLLISTTAISLRNFTVALKIMLLDMTPPQIIVIILLLLAVYATQYGLAPFLQIQQLVFMSNNFILIPVILLGFLSVNTIDTYLPILAKGLTPIIKGIVPSWFAYCGPELVVGLIYPYVTRQKGAVTWGAAGVAVLTVLYTLLTIIVQGVLTPKETAHIILPTISAYKEIEIPDTFIERLDGYLMVLWIPLYFTSLINLFYFSAFGWARLFKQESSRSVTILLVPLIYYLINLASRTQTISAINNYFTIADMVWALGIVPVLLGIAWLKEKKRRLC